MKIRIIRGTNQIGGCITEISTKKSKIIIDFGEELSDDLRKKDEIDVEVTIDSPKELGLHGITRAFENAPKPV